MSALDSLRSLSPQQRNTVIAAYLGWTLDAFDFFILVFVLKHIADEFHTDVPAVSVAIFLTLAMRAVGALIFGLAADRFGRRITLMANVLLYSIFEFLHRFLDRADDVPDTTGAFRHRHGRRMGCRRLADDGNRAGGLARHRVGHSASRLSFRLSAGFDRVLPAVPDHRLARHVHGRRCAGAAGALHPPQRAESPSFLARQAKPQRPFLTVLRENIPAIPVGSPTDDRLQFLFSHGTQDLYPTFLEAQRQYDSYTVGAIAIVYNIGAMIGGLFFGALSQRIGRRRAIVIASVLAIPVAPLWVYAHGPVLLAVGAFLMQFFVQGARGIVPVHLNELSPDEVRGTFPGFAYQLGNLLASGNATIQAAWRRIGTATMPSRC